MKVINLLLISLMSIATTAQAMQVPAVQAKVPRHAFTAEQTQAIVEHNERVAANDFVNNLFSDYGVNKFSTVPARVPWAEYHQAGYLIFSDDTPFDSGVAKLKMAMNLPKDMTLVVYTRVNDKYYQEALYREYAEYVGDKDRVRVIYLPIVEPIVNNKPQPVVMFWARDGVPVPAWSYDATGAEKFTVVDAKYYHYFESDALIGEYFKADVVKHDYMTEGGNFVSNSRGECIMVDNSRVKMIPDAIFTEKYGCKEVIRMPYLQYNGPDKTNYGDGNVYGIGHIDERVKFMDDDTLITDDERYAQILRDKGYKVVMMTRPVMKYETYVNSLIVNGTAFVPVFKYASDDEAVKIYESFGLKVVRLDSYFLSNEGAGSIHCITMVYPPVEFNTLLKSIGAQAYK